MEDTRCSGEGDLPAAGGLGTAGGRGALPAAQRGQQARAIILAASRGAALGELTAQRPKAMVEIRGEPLLEHIVSGLQRRRHQGHHRRDRLCARRPSTCRRCGTSTIRTMRILASCCPWPAHSRPTGGRQRDLLRVLRRCDFQALHSRQPGRAAEAAFVIAVDSDWQASVNRARAADYVTLQRAELAPRVLSRDQPAAGRRKTFPTLSGMASGWAWRDGRRGAAALSARSSPSWPREPQPRRSKLHVLLSALVERGEDDPGGLHHRPLAGRGQPRRPGGCRQLRMIEAATFHRGRQASAVSVCMLACPVPI